MAEERNDEVVVGSGSPPIDEALTGREIIRRWAMGDEELLPAAVEESIEDLVASKYPILDLFIYGVVTRRVRGIVRILAELQQVEGILFDPERLGGMDSEVLTRLLGLLNTNLDNHLKFVQQFDPRSAQRAVDMSEDSTEAKFSKLSPDSKRAVMKHLQSLVALEGTEKKNED